MKRLFSKKSGFTVVEIVIAFLIFAIMSGMILAVLRLAVDQRKSNNDFANEIDSQTELLVKNDKEKKSTQYNDGKITISKDDGTNLVSVKYATAGVTEGGVDDGINYFIGEYNQNEGGVLTDDNAEGNGKAVNKRVDSRIYGSTYFDAIYVYDVTRDTSYSGSGVRYVIECSAKNKKKDGTTDNVFSDEILPYRQYILFFPNQNIKEVGYVEGSSYKNAKTTVAPLTDNKYTVKSVGKASVLISIPKSQIQYQDGVYKGLDFAANNHTKMYVVFENDPGILPAGINSTASLASDKKEEILKYFGDNIKLDTSTNVYCFTSSEADSIVNTGKDEKDKIRCDNIYGVKKSAKEVNPDPDETTEP
ncbi:MAG: type II secretion system protein J [Oscillospiraceae bacterium]